MGRVFNLVNVMYTGFMPLGMAIFGLLANVVRIQTMVIGCSVLIIILGMSVLSSGKYYRQGVSVSNKPDDNATTFAQKT